MRAKLGLGVLALAVGVLGAQEPPTAVREESPDDPPAASASAQPRAAAPPVVRGNHRSIQINVDAAGMDIVGDAANEPSLAISLIDPDDIVVGWRQFDSIASNFRQAGRAYSLDRGASWTFPGVLQPGQFRSDPVLGADSTGRFFYYSLSSTTTTEYFVSEDGGVTWDGPRGSFGGDKNWMAIDTTGGLGDGHVYSIWNSQFTCCAAGTDFARSIDAAVSHEGPFVLPSKVKWGTVAVGPDGEVYVVGIPINDAPPHLILRSTNARDPLLVPSFSLVRTVQLGGPMAFGGAPNPGGLLGQTWVATDRSTGASRGNVYVLGTINPAGTDPADVMFSRSENGGDTWSTPVRIHDDPAGGYQWFGTLSVAPNGRIDAIWNDTRIHPSGVQSEVYYGYSTDEGQTWSAALPVSPRFSSIVGYPQQNKIGDYYHMISDAAGASLAYAATFRGGQDVYFLRVGDCNANGLHDSADLAAATSEDCNENGVPDECEPIPPCTACDGDGVCEPGESCQNCPFDCAGTPSCCGDAVCNGPETPASCAADCNTLDTDLDDTRNIFDCAPLDASAFAIPPEVVGERFSGDKETLTWTSVVPGTGSGTVYDVLRGVITELPVGSGPSETCLEFSIPVTSASIVGDPPPGQAWYILVRAANVCGTGSLGTESDGTPRIGVVCEA